MNNGVINGGVSNRGVNNRGVANEGVSTVVLIAEVQLTGHAINGGVNNRGVSNGGINNRGVGNGGVSNGGVNNRGVINRTCDSASGSFFGHRFFFVTMDWTLPWTGHSRSDKKMFQSPEKVSNCSCSRLSHPSNTSGGRKKALASASKARTFKYLVLVSLKLVECRCH